MSENRFYFLFWGWITFAAIVAQFLLKVVLKYEQHYYAWFIILPAVIVTMIYSSRRHRKKHSTYVGDSMKYLWTGIGISFFVLSFIISYTKTGWLSSYPFFIVFYGLGTFVSGMFLKFKPLIIGGIFNWVLACICVQLPYDYQMLTAAVAILTSYIIPGYLLSPKKESYGV